MTDNLIGIDASGLAEIQVKLDKLPPEAADDGVEAANEYIVHFEQAYSPYKYVSVAQSGGWKSERQRRYVMAKIRSGEIQIPYRRTQTLRAGWQTVGSGSTQIVVNQVSYAGYVKDIQRQTYGHMLRGWDVIQTDMQERGEEITRRFDGGVKKAMQRLGLD